MYRTDLPLTPLHLLRFHGVRSSETTQCSTSLTTYQNVSAILRSCWSYVAVRANAPVGNFTMINSLQHTCAIPMYRRHREQQENTWSVFLLHQFYVLCRLRCEYARFCVQGFLFWFYALYINFYLFIHTFVIKTDAD